VAQHPGQNRPLGDFWTVDAASEQVWVWCQIHMKVDFISFPTSPESPQSDSVCNRGDRRKLKVCCSPNPAYASPFPFRSSPWFLIKTRVHVSPRSKQDGQELKKELTWWLTFRARARVIGPAVVGVDVWSVLMSSSSSLSWIWVVLEHEHEHEHEILSLSLSRVSHSFRYEYLLRG